MGPPRGPRKRPHLGPLEGPLWHNQWGGSGAYRLRSPTLFFSLETFCPFIPHPRPPPMSPCPIRAKFSLSFSLFLSLEGTGVKGCMGREGDDRGDRGNRGDRECRGISGDLDHTGGRELTWAQTLMHHETTRPPALGAPENPRGPSAGGSPETYTPDRSETP